MITLASQLSALFGLAGFGVWAYLYLFLDGQLQGDAAEQMASLGLRERHPTGSLIGLGMVVSGFVMSFVFSRLGGGSAAAPAVEDHSGAIHGSKDAPAFKCGICGDQHADRAFIFSHVRTRHDKGPREAQDHVVPL